MKLGLLFIKRSDSRTESTLYAHQVGVFAFFLAFLILGFNSNLFSQQQAIQQYRCRNAMLFFLQLDPLALESASAEQEVTFELAQAINNIRHRFLSQVSGVGHAPTTEVCTRESQQLFEAGIRWLDRRFQLLARQNNTEIFFREWNRMSLAFASEQEAEEIRIRLESSWLALIRMLRTRLENQIAGHARFSWVISVNATPRLWLTKWAELFGDAGHAALFYPGHEYSLRVERMTLPEAEVFLFHELAHLNSPWSNPETNERLAWQWTLEYLQLRETVNLPIPDSFVRIRQNILNLGLDAWVRGIFDRRGANANLLHNPTPVQSLNTH